MVFQNKHQTKTTFGGNLLTVAGLQVASCRLKHATRNLQHKNRQHVGKSCILSAYFNFILRFVY